MPTQNREAQLLRLLEADPDLAQRGCSGERRVTGGIAIIRGGHHRGLWVWQGTRFEYTPGGYASPTAEFDTAIEALLHTRNAICPGK